MAHLKPSHVLALIYADIFDYPLTNEEMNRYAINSQYIPGALALKPVSSQQYHHLPGRESLVAQRTKRERISQKKLLKSQIIADKLARLPTILGIFVTGNLAMNNAANHDDIDLLIITKSNRLWISRLLITLYLEITGIRRRPNQTKTSDHICANMYLDETVLTMPASKHNLYTAHEVVQVKPLISRNHIYERFLTANSWVSGFLPNFPIPNEGKTRTSYFVYPERSRRVLRPSLFESLAYLLQRLYMKKRMTRETITPHTAFFHPRDTGSKVLKSYQSNVQLFLNPKS
jgi:hypothetical protein